MFKWDVAQIIAWLQSHFKLLAVAVFLCVLAGLGYIFFNKWNESQEEKAKDSLVLFQKSLKDLEKSLEEEDSNLFDFPQEEEELVLTDEMKTKAGAYKKALEENKKYKISLYFAIDLADFYYRYGETKTAIQLLSQFTSPLAKETLSQLASFQLASYYMNEKKCEPALDLFDKLLSNKSAKGFFKESQLQKGICLEKLNRYREALKEYDSLAVQNPGSYIGRQAKDYKRLLILKQKLNKKTKAER